MPKRINWIDLAKGMTIVLVVFGHVIIGLFDARIYSGLTQQLLLVLVQAIYLFHMPVFFALSGYFFTACRTWPEFLDRLKKRSITIGIPYLGFSVILCLLFQIGKNSVRQPVDWHALLDIWQKPIGPLWFLYVLFVVIIANSLLSLFIKDIRMHLGVAILLAVVANFWVFPIYAFQRLLIWTPFFLLGAYFRQYPLKGSWRRASLLLAIYSLYLVFWSASAPTTRVNYNAPGFDSLMMVIAILLAFMFFPKLGQKTRLNQLFDPIGQQSLGIYLIHVPIVSMTRISLQAMGITNLVVHIVIGFTVGWLGSLAVLKYVPYMDHLLYPLRFLPHTNNRKASTHDKN